MKKKICILVICFLVFMLLFAVLLKDKGEFAVGTKVYSIELPSLIKFAALIEREEYYKAWLREVIDIDGIKSDEEKNEKARSFCNLMAVAGYPACRIYNSILPWVPGGQEGKVIVKIGLKNEFLYFDFENKDSQDGTPNAKEFFIRDNDKKLCEAALLKLDNVWGKAFNGKYLWGDLNVSKYAFFCYLQKVQKPEHIEFIIN